MAAEFPVPIDLANPSGFWAKAFRFARGKSAYRLQITGPTGKFSPHHVVSFYWKAGPASVSKHIRIPDSAMSVWIDATSDAGVTGFSCGHHEFGLKGFFPGGDALPSSIDLPRMWSWWKPLLAAERMEKRTAPAPRKTTGVPRL